MADINALMERERRMFSADDVTLLNAHEMVVTLRTGGEVELTTLVYEHVGQGDKFIEGKRPRTVRVAEFVDGQPKQSSIVASEWIPTERGTPNLDRLRGWLNDEVGGVAGAPVLAKRHQSTPGARIKRRSGRWHTGYITVQGGRVAVRDSRRRRSQYATILDRHLAEPGTVQLRLPNGRYADWREVVK